MQQFGEILKEGSFVLYRILEASGISPLPPLVNQQRSMQAMCLRRSSTVLARMGMPTGRNRCASHVFVFLCFLRPERSCIVPRHPKCRRAIKGGGQVQGF